MSASAMEKGRTAVVILNYNTRDYLAKFLPLLLESTGCEADGVPDPSGTEVIVADNASADGSVELLKNSFPGVRRIVFDRNYGFAEGYDRALEQLAGEFRYYVLINSDIEVPQGWIKPLEEWMDSHPECGACAPKLHSWYKRDIFEYAGAAGGLIDRFGYPFCRGRVLDMVEQDVDQYDSLPQEVFWASGACLMVRSELFHRLGGLDRRFFAHMEEIDLCWRMQLEGYTVCIVPQSVVYHIGGGTLPASSPWKLQLNYRNSLLMLDNNLAKTFGLDALRRGQRTDDAAAKADRKARRIITERMILDGFSAMVYLFTLKFGKFAAVIKAHGEYRRMKTDGTLPSLWNWLEASKRAGSIKIHGYYRGCIILQALLKKEKVFNRIQYFK